jgi:hypothetical protein
MPKVARQPDTPLTRALVRKWALRAAVRQEYAVAVAQAGKWESWQAVKHAVDAAWRASEKGRG